MGQVIVRNLDDEVIAEAAKPTREELLQRLAACRALTPPGPRKLAEDLIREDRDNR